MNERFKIRFLAVFSIILLCIANTIKPLQNDTFYIIKLGEYISKYGVDLMDHYCWVTDLNYTYPHWLYDLIIYFIYYNFDFVGIYVSSIILFIILILSLYLIILRFTKNEFISLLSSFVSIGSLIGFVTARAQLVTIILFLWQVYFIEQLIRFGKKIHIVFLCLISLLVANLHSTIWLFCFILYLPFFVEYFVCKLSNLTFLKNFFYELMENDKIIIDKVENIFSVFIAFILSFIMGIFTPSRICYSYIFKIMRGNSQSYIIEHAPLVIIEHPCFLILILIILFILIFSNTKIKLRELFMFCGLILMSFCSVRHVAFFYVIGIIYFSVLLNRYLNNRDDKTLDILLSIVIKNKIIYHGILIFIVIFSTFSFYKNSLFDYIPEKEYPVDAVNYIKSNLDIDNMRLFNDYNFGSYLLFNNISVFIDSRCDLYLKEFNGLNYSIFDDFFEITDNYEKKFKKYDVTHVLLYKEDIFSRILIRDLNYNVIYADKNFILFEKLSS